MKRIGIDKQTMAGQKTGFGFYLENLLSALDGLNKNYEFVFIDEVRDNLNTPRRMLWDQIWLPRRARKLGLDLLFVPAFSVPLFYKGKTVVTAHDLIGYLFSNNFSWSAKMYWKRLLPASFRKADHIITISVQSRNDLHEHLGIPLEKITVIPLAARSVFHPLKDEALIEPVLKSYGLRRDKFVLTVGTIEPRKNIPALIEAWSKLKRDPRMKLVIVGKKSWGYLDVKRIVETLELEKEVMILDYISDNELVVLYNTCHFFVLPSLYEGFGLPALEALSCGAAVTMANNSSLPEAGGDAASYFDPRQPEEMRAKMQEMLDNEKARAFFREKGLAQAAKFSWDITARHTLAVFDHLLK